MTAITPMRIDRRASPGRGAPVRTHPLPPFGGCVRFFGDEQLQDPRAALIARIQETADRITFAVAMLGTGVVAAIAANSLRIWP
jgi:hypothetical protein